MRRRLGAGVALAGLTGVVPSVLSAPAQRGAKVDWPAVRLLDGRVLGADSIRESATIVTFFSTSCPYCQRQNAHLDKLLRVHPNLPLRVILAAHDRRGDAVQEYLTRHAYKLDVTLDSAPLHAALSERRIIPLTCVIDRQGVLREVIPGEMFEEDVLELARWARA